MSIARTGRWLTALLIVLGGVLVATRTHETTTTTPQSYGYCTSTALARAFSGPFRLDSLDGFGCENGAAYAWATVGPHAHEIGVTEVLLWDQDANHWRFTSRQTWCVPANGRRTPTVYQLGCFSN
jgi:hypothetical protein